MSDILEPFAITDQFCEQLIRIDNLGPCRRLVFAVRDTVCGEPVRNVSAKIIVSAEAMIEIGRMLQAGAAETNPLATFHPELHRAN
jgi:hypothetical protein